MRCQQVEGVDRLPKVKDGVLAVDTKAKARCRAPHLGTVVIAIQTGNPSKGNREGSAAL
jgi:hypothetical protein